MTEAKRIAFLGLGVMGAPMAGHLARSGHRVTVYNRTAARAEESDALGLCHARPPAAFAGAKQSLPSRGFPLPGIFGYGPPP